MSNKLVVAEQDREGVNGDKIKHFLGVAIKAKTAGADVYAERFSNLNIETLRIKTGKKLEHILLDVDDCIAPPYGPIILENLRHIESIKKSGVGIGIYSNCKGMDRLNLFERNGYPNL